VNSLLESVWSAFDRAGVRACALRGHRPDDAPAFREDVDVLVDEQHLSPARALLARLGFVELRAWGRAPHHFFVAYDAERDEWLKLDIVTQIALGHPYHVWPTELASSFLSRRLRRRGAWVLSPEDEFLLLLLHGVVDKGALPANRRCRLVQLANEVQDRGYLAAALHAYWGPHMPPGAVMACVRSGDWETLMAARRSVVRHLARRGQLRARARALRDRLLRRGQRVFEVFFPQHPSVALVAPDGAGKSTLAASLQATFFFPVHVEYMGLYAGGRRRRPWWPPGLGLVTSLGTLWWRWARARYHRARGRLVLFDRYTYDALVAAPPREGRLRRLRRHLLARACPPPNVLLVLDAPARVLFRRKGEQGMLRLERARRRYLELAASVAGAVVLDATRPPEAVRREATAIIWAAYRGRRQELSHDKRHTRPYHPRAPLL